MKEYAEVVASVNPKPRPTARRRLTPTQRRAELIDAGERIFRSQRFEDVSMDDIARAAGVTRALLYHYFPTKAEFFGAIWSHAHERLGATGSDPSATVRDNVITALRAYLDFYREHLPLVVVANRSSIARDEAVRGPIERYFALLIESVLDDTGTRGHSRDIARASFLGWISFVRETTLVTLLERDISHEENLALCIAVLDATVGRYADLGCRSG